jgi:hypothetical protein
MVQLNANLLPHKTNLNKNISTDHLSQEDIDLINYNKTHYVNNIQNPNLIKNDIPIVFFDENIHQKNNANYNYNNDIRKINTDQNNQYNYESVHKKHDIHNYNNDIRKINTDQNNQYNYESVHKKHDIHNYNNDMRKINTDQNNHYNYENVHKKHDIHNYNNDMRRINTDQGSYVDYKEDNMYKNNNLLYGQNVYVNSSFNLPECTQYNFYDLLPVKNNTIMTNNLPVFRDLHQNLSNETNNLKRHNGYQFSDTIGTNYSYTANDIVHSDIKDNETNLRSMNNYQQENKANNIKNDNVWNNAKENDNVNKSQKQVRTSGTDDASYIDGDIYNSMEENNPDFESFSGGSIIGKKSSRADRFGENYSENMNL